MIRLTWLQFRAQAVTAAAALAAFAVLLAATGPHLASLYAASGIPSCQGASCQNLASAFLQQLSAAGDTWVYLISVASILLAPALIGLFWGAPLIAHELETGTSALAWNQSITRTRWLAVKLTVGGLAAMAVTEGLSLMQAWWAAPIGRAVGHGGVRHPPRHGPVQHAGLRHPRHHPARLRRVRLHPRRHRRRADPAHRARPWPSPWPSSPSSRSPCRCGSARTSLPARHTVIPVTSLDNTSQTQRPARAATALSLGALNLPGQPGAWLLSSGTVNAAGQATSTAPAICFTPSVENSSTGFVDCLASHGIREEISYQPASRYWPFQWTETAIYLALTLALAGYCFRRLNRRLS